MLTWNPASPALANSFTRPHTVQSTQNSQTGLMPWQYHHVGQLIVPATTTPPTAVNGSVQRTITPPPAPVHTSTPASQPPPAASGSAQADAQQIFGSQYSCAANIIERESGWNVYATNPGSGAYGLPQALPGSKMAAFGADWQTNPATQLEWMLNYVNSTYGGACAAWSFWQAHSWY